MDYDLERENFLHFYKTATVEEMSLARRDHLEMLNALLRKYAHAINIINLVYWRTGTMSDVNVMEPVGSGLKPAHPENLSPNALIGDPKLDDQEAESLNAKMQKHIECKITAFDMAIAETSELEIDGISLDDNACEKITMESKIKVVNHQTKDAYEVEIDTIVRTPLKDLILALKTGELIRLQGVTRIVGYYSRIQNWNKSKIGELQDRHKGNYRVK